MRALVIGDHDILTAKIGEIITCSGLAYRSVDVARLESSFESASRGRYDLIVLVLPSDGERCEEVLRAIRNATQSPLVAIGPTDNAQRVLQVLRQGADEYLDQNEFESELRTSLPRLRARQPSQVHNGWVVGLLAASGGSGSSTLAVNLAVLLAKSRGQAALVDLRAAASDLAVLLDLKPTHNMADLCRNLHRLDQGMVQQSMLHHASGVHLLAAPERFEDAAQVSPQGVRGVLAFTRTLFPSVVLDLDRSLGPEQVAAVLQADLLLLVLRLDIASLRNARRVLDHLGALGVPPSRFRGVANRYGQAKELPLRKVEQALGITIPYCIPDDPATVNGAGNMGVPVVLERPRSSISKGLLRLATDVEGLQELHRHNGHGTPDPRPSAPRSPFDLLQEGR
jgi:pilus assembly protein CpaE